MSEIDLSPKGEAQPDPEPMGISLVERQGWEYMLIQALRGEKYEIGLFKQTGPNRFVEMEGTAYERQKVKFVPSKNPGIALCCNLVIPPVDAFPVHLGLTHFAIISGLSRQYIRLGRARKIYAQVTEARTLDVSFLE